MTAKKSSKKQKKSRLRWIWPLVIACFFLITVAAAGYFLLFAPGPSSSPETGSWEKPLSPATKSRKAHPGRIEPGNTKQKVPAQSAAASPEKTDTALKEIDGVCDGRGLLAIIIDDMGEQRRIGQSLLDLDLPLSFAFLPFASHTGQLVQSARQRGRDILLHLPMEPEDPQWDPGRGALYTSMSPRMIEKTIAADLAMVPGAIGVNNHMGSRYSADRLAMQSCLAYLGRKDLFFIDSLTTSNSVAWSTARDSGLKTARRDIFLDNSKDVEAIKKNIRDLVEIACRYGQSIGIGHPYQETLEALRQSRDILGERVQVVAIHELVE